jgi:predicted nucleotidyltransferase
MAGQTHAVDIGDDDLLPPWTTVFEVARAIDVSDWVLVGGLMVQLHARRASITPPRATKDVDLIADVQTNRSSFGSIGSALTSIGFEVAVPDARNEPIYRFSRGDEQVDVMVADHLPSGMKPRLRARPAFAVDGGAQALNRRDTLVITSTSGTITIDAPDVLGALIGKGAAYMVDQRDRGRHVEDAAVLLASIDSVGDLDLTLNTNDRKRLRALATDLQDDLHPGWLVLDEGARVRGQRNLDLLIREARLEVRKAF